MRRTAQIVTYVGASLGILPGLVLVLFVVISELSLNSYQKGTYSNILAFGMGTMGGTLLVVGVTALTGGLLTYRTPKLAAAILLTLGIVPSLCLVFVVLGRPTGFPILVLLPWFAMFLLAGLLICKSLKQ